MSTTGEPYGNAPSGIGEAGFESLFPAFNPGTPYVVLLVVSINTAI